MRKLLIIVPIFFGIVFYLADNLLYEPHERYVCKKLGSNIANKEYRSCLENPNQQENILISQFKQWKLKDDVIKRLKLDINTINSQLMAAVREEDKYKAVDSSPLPEKHMEWGHFNNDLRTADDLLKGENFARQNPYIKFKANRFSDFSTIRWSCRSQFDCDFKIHPRKEDMQPGLLNLWLSLTGATIPSEVYLQTYFTKDISKQDRGIFGFRLVGLKIAKKDLEENNDRVFSRSIYYFMKNTKAKHYPQLEHRLKELISSYLGRELKYLIPERELTGPPNLLQRNK